MSNRRKIIIAIVFVAVLALAGPLVAISVDNSKPEQMTAAVELASRDASKFLQDFVQGDGTVRVQGVGVSQAQAQAWAMLIAASTSDQRFDNIWQRYQDMSSAQKTTVTDLNAAWALGIAGKNFKNELYTGTANNIAFEALVHPEATDGSELYGLFFRGILTIPAADANLSLRALISNQRSLIDTQMKPDSAAFSRLPGRDGYSGDAQFVPLNLASSCDASDKDRATFIWTKLRESRDTRTASALSVEGGVVDKTKSARAAVASSAAAQAAGEQLQSLHLLDDADGIADNERTTTNAAASTIGRLVLTTDRLGSCG